MVFFLNVEELYSVAEWRNDLGCSWFLQSLISVHKLKQTILASVILVGSTYAVLSKTYTQGVSKTATIVITEKLDK